jgi:toxin YoeB
VSWKVVFTKQAQKNYRFRIKAQGGKADKFASRKSTSKPPFLCKTGCYFSGAYSRRINIQHRLVYQVLEKERIVKVIRMWAHYE